jgi:hypothetical protein
MLKEHHNICKIKKWKFCLQEVTRIATKKFEQMRIEEQKSVLKH